MDSPDYAVESRKVVCDFVNQQVFNYAVVLFGDSHQEKMLSWYYMGGHPYNWDNADKAYVASKMCESAAEHFKSDEFAKVQNQTFKTRARIIFEKPYYSSHYVCLLCLQLWFLNPTKRHFFWIEFCMNEIGISASFKRDLKSTEDKLFWSAQLLLGPFLFRLTGDQ